MTTVVFDTHDFVRRLHKVGFSEEQAEMVTKLQQEAVNASLEQMHNVEVATRQDFRETALALKHGLREVELKIELKISETKAELVRWVIGVALLQTTIIAALLLKKSSGL